jgi:hypothetical protein
VQVPRQCVTCMQGPNSQAPRAQWVMVYNNAQSKRIQAASEHNKLLFSSVFLQAQLCNKHMCCFLPKCMPQQFFFHLEFTSGL